MLHRTENAKSLSGHRAQCLWGRARAQPGELTHWPSREAEGASLRAKAWSPSWTSLGSRGGAGLQREVEEGWPKSWDLVSVTTQRCGSFVSCGVTGSKFPAPTWTGNRPEVGSPEPQSDWQGRWLTARRLAVPLTLLCSCTREAQRVLVL